MNSKNVLLVIDNDKEGNEIGNTIKQCGYSVVSTDCLNNTIDAINTMIDSDLIVIIDIDLGNGKEGAVIGKTIQEKHDIPIVYFYDYESNKSIKKLSTVKSKDFITKVADKDFLGQSIDFTFSKYYE